jgi:hypothetical protein
MGRWKSVKILVGALVLSGTAAAPGWSAGPLVRWLRVRRGMFGLAPVATILLRDRGFASYRPPAGRMVRDLCCPFTLATNAGPRDPPAEYEDAAADAGVVGVPALGHPRVCNPRPSSRAASAAQSRASPGKIASQGAAVR